MDLATSSSSVATMRSVFAKRSRYSLRLRARPESRSNQAHGVRYCFQRDLVGVNFPNDEIFLTTEEVLEYLQVNLRTVYRLIKAGKIPAVRVGRQWRFRKRDIDAWLRSEERRVGKECRRWW